MLTLSWRRAGASTGLALALIVGLPSLADAQLFPNMWIQRKRNECANEPPFYGHVRRDFYGYYPTCWRTFPEGWACPCPNPEAPNAAQSFIDRPRDKPEKYDDLDPLDDAGGRRDGVAPPPGPRGEALPGVPNGGRSPFEMDNNNPRPVVPPSPDDELFRDPPARNPRGGGIIPRPSGAPRDSSGPAPATGADPFDAPLGEPRGSANGAKTPTPTAPAIDGPSAARPRRAPSRPLAEADPNESSTPVLALPAMTAPAGSLPGEPPQVAALPPSLPSNGAYIEIPTTSAPASDVVVSGEPIQAPTAQPAKAPTRRTSIIGSLFGMGNRTTR